MDLIEILYATGIMALLARMCRDVHDIRKVFKDMKEEMKKIQETILDHAARITNLEKRKTHERLVQKAE